MPSPSSLVYLSLFSLVCLLSCHLYIFLSSHLHTILSSHLHTILSFLMVLAGDPFQLPPFTLSEGAKEVWPSSYLNDVRKFPFLILLLFLPIVSMMHSTYDRSFRSFTHLHLLPLSSAVLLQNRHAGDFGVSRLPRGVIRPE